nr:hypothetical protein [Tanacetum cinerariifolium]
PKKKFNSPIILIPNSSCMIFAKSLGTDMIKRDKFQAKPDKTEHKTENEEKSTVRSQQKVKPNKVEAKETKKSRKIKKRD